MLPLTSAEKYLLRLLYTKRGIFADSCGPALLELISRGLASTNEGYALLTTDGWRMAKFLHGPPSYADTEPTQPQYRYRPTPGTEFVIESIVYGDKVSGPLTEHINFVAMANSEAEAIRQIKSITGKAL